MSVEMAGIFRAEVLDTSMFKESGRIKIHVKGVNTPEAYEMAAVMTPFGGLPNMGMQALPPIGAYGLVLFERERDQNPIWMGSLMRYWGEELNDNTAHPVEAEDPTDFVIKTQYTSIDDQELDGNNKVENVIKMNEEAITLSKIQQGGNYEYQVEGYDSNEEFPANTITIKDDEIRLKVRTDGDDADRVFVVNGDELRLEWGSDQTMTVTEDKTIIKNGEADITVYNDGKVEINAEKIHLNGTDGTGVFYEGIRDFINNAFNSHTHGTPSGPSSPPIAPYTSISTAKSSNVKLS